MIPAYGIMPLMICMIVTTIMSYQLTYNESFILTVIMMIGGIWSIAEYLKDFQQFMTMTLNRQ